MATYSLLLVVILVMCLNVADPSFIYVDNDDGQTVSTGSIDSRQKKELQQEVLGLLGLHSKPDTTPNEDLIQSASEFMRNLYRVIEDVTSFEFPVDSRIHIKKEINATAHGLDPAKVEGADVIASFVNNGRCIQYQHFPAGVDVLGKVTLSSLPLLSERPAHIPLQRASTLRRQNDMTFYFEVSAGEQINVAELRVFKEISPAFAQGSFAINLYIIKPGLDRRERILDLETSLKVEWNTKGWLTLNATTAVTTWTTIPHLNMGMYLRVVDSQGRMRDPKDVGIVGRKGPANKQSFLVAYIKMSKETVSSLQTRIKKRSIDAVDKSYAESPYSARPSTESSTSQDKCQRHKLYINFRDIGFDPKFLISPDGYSAFYCSGKCLFPLDKGMNASNHAIVQALIHLMNPELVPMPCCSPDQYGSIPFLYFDSNNTLIIRNLSNMVVKSCGCF